MLREYDTKMVDDLNRDFLPVKEIPCPDSCRSSIDPKERHLVCKLDRYQLEDRYLRLYEEAQSLKKLTNCQEDKIRRLTTKLMRINTNPRACPAVLEFCDEKNKFSILECENSKLKDQITVLKTQMTSHTHPCGRSTSRGRKSPNTTLRSDNNRKKISPYQQCVTQRSNNNNNNNEIHNYILKIEELESQKNHALQRNAEMEMEFEKHLTNCRTNIEENIECIKVWRELKQVNDQLLNAEQSNESLNRQIFDLKKIIEETNKNNDEINKVLAAERHQKIEMDEQLLKLQDAQLTLREKDERINDLTNELAILQQHNEELTDLGTRYGQIELENIELKRKISVRSNDDSNSNSIVLKTINEQLFKKLEQLQNNIDVLNIQLSNFKRPDDDNPETSSNHVPKSKSKTETSEKSCGTSLKSQNVSAQTEIEPRIKIQMIDKTINTDEDHSRMTKRIDNQINVPNEGELNNVSLSREKILKLLDQAQINTPMDVIKITGTDPTNSDEHCSNDIERRSRNRSVDIDETQISHEKILDVNNNTPTESNNKKSVKIHDEILCKFDCPIHYNGETQDLMEIHIICLKLATLAPCPLCCKNINDVSIFISWQTWDNEIYCTPPVKYPTLDNFNKSFVHRIAELPFFLDRILMDHIIFCVQMINRNTTTSYDKIYQVAKSKFSIKDILDYPEKKLSYIVPLNSALSCISGDKLGQLELWVKLTCDVRRIEIFKRQKNLINLTRPGPSSPMSSIMEEGDEYNDEQFDTTDQTLKEENERIYSSDSSSTTTLDENMNEIKGIPTKTIMYKEENNQEYMSSQSVTEFNDFLNDENGNSLDSSSSEDLRKILSNESWNQYRRTSTNSAMSLSKFYMNLTLLLLVMIFPGIRSMGIVLTILEDKQTNGKDDQLDNGPDNVHELRELDQNSKFMQITEPNAIIIEIVSLVFTPRSPILKNKDVRLIYVEYTFLGHRGADMETISLKKPQSSHDELFYRFKKKFFIDKTSHRVERESLCAMMDGSKSPEIKFIVVSEPSLEETDIKDCEDIGYALLNLQQYLSGGIDGPLSLPVVDPKNSQQQIGTLKVSISGIDAISHQSTNSK